ncbi:MAG: hypothetical protein IKT50_02560 [Clostridia bacterium]|nr:hypothetical protein [Clostridia bacterium]
MWYFYLSPKEAAKAVSLIAGDAVFFSWEQGLLSVRPAKEKEKLLRRRLAAFGIFPCEKT